MDRLVFGRGAAREVEKEGLETANAPQQRPWQARGGALEELLGSSRSNGLQPANDGFLGVFPGEWMLFPLTYQWLVCMFVPGCVQVLFPFFPLTSGGN